MRARQIACVIGMAAAWAMAQAPALTTVSDSVYAALPNATVRAVLHDTMATADHFTVLRGAVFTGAIANGVLTIALPPNVGSAPATTYYTVYYSATTGVRDSELWVVPASTTPVALATVRALVPPALALTYAISQVSVPGGCANELLGIAPNGTSWACIAALANPMTAVGQLIEGGVGGEAIALTPGAAGTVLTSAGPGASIGWQAPSGGGAVSSAFGRTGAVVAQNGDYSFAQISGLLSALQLPTSFTAPLAAALAATPTTCGGGQFAAGVLASGNATGCGSPAAQVYPGAGVPNSTGTAWASSYQVGTAAGDLVQLGVGGALPPVSAANLTNFPTLNQSTTGNAATASACATTNACWPDTAAAINTLAPFTFALQASQLPDPSATTLGGIESLVATPHEWLDSISTAGAPHASQPGFGDLSGSAACAQLPALTGDATSSAGSCATAVATMTGDSGSGGAKGLVPAPGAGTAAAGKFLRADGAWAVPGVGSAYTAQSWEETVGPSGSGVAGGDIVPTQLALWGIEIQHPTAVADIMFMISGISGTVNASICAYGPFVSPGASLALAVSTANTGYTTTGTVKAAIAAGGTTTVQPGLYFVGVDVGPATTFNLYGTNSNDGIYFYRSNAVATSQTGACPASIPAPTPSSIITNHTAPWIAFTAN